jgi:hypothetical protein
MDALLWAHRAYLVLLVVVVSGCLWMALRMDR